MLGYFLVLHGEHVGHEFHEQYFRTHGIVEISQFGADGATTHDNHGCGTMIERQGLTIADDAFPVLRDVGQLAGTGSRGQNDVFGLVQGLFPGGVGHLHLFVGGKFTGTFDHRDVVLFKQVLDSFAHLVGNTPAAGDDGVKIRFRVLYFNPVIGSMSGVLQYLC